MGVLIGLVANPFTRKLLIWGLLALAVVAAVLWWRNAIFKAGALAEKIKEAGKTYDAVKRKLRHDAAIGGLSGADLDRRMRERRSKIAERLLRSR